MSYTISEIQQILQADLLQSARPQGIIDHLVLDSRQLTAPGRSVFFAIKGLRHNGHRFIPDLYHNGLRYFVVSQPPADNLPEADILLVPDTLTALQKLAAHHRSLFPEIPVIGITGSNGKTIVKEWLYQLLHTDYVIARSPKSYNSQTGVPLSVWQLQPRHTLAIFEAGISQPGEMERLSPIIQPDIGVFTNIGEAHREGFLSDEQKVSEKMRLFESARLLIYCQDYPLIQAAVTRWTAEKENRQAVAWSKTDPNSQYYLSEIQTQSDGSALLTLQLPTGLQRMQLPFSDPASIENALHCWVILHKLGITPERIQARMRRLEPVEMRLELKEAVNRSLLINDAYNSDPVSLNLALQFAVRQNSEQPLTLILSDILQTGLSPEELYRQVSAAIVQYGVKRLIGIGPEIPVVKHFLPDSVETVFFPDTETFLNNIASLRFADETVLLKGARPFAFERIANRLEQKAHKTRLEINLSALIHNLNVYSRLLRPGVRLMAMVKAAAYGSGGAQVAKLLEFHKVDYLGVAYADEGIYLRESGVSLPILVLNPEPAGFDALYRYNLEPEVYSLPLLEELLRFAGSRFALRIHLKLDTGMRRLGFEAADLPQLLDSLKAHPNLHVESIFSHLTSSDRADHDDFTHRQATGFINLYEEICAGLGYRPLRHLVNTGGIARFPDYHFDMVRLGIGLYGVDSSGLQEQLKVVNTLKATVSQIKTLPAGETVGYNRNGRMEQAGRIATISIGYADGLLRLAGNGRYSVFINGKLAPTIGNVCMDMTMLDVTAIPDTRVGDEVIIFGEQPAVHALAAALQTIPYEVFTNISDRVKRVYWQE